MNVVLLITILGPALGITGWFAGTGWLFWVGVALCAINLLMNLASGVMKLPLLPLTLMAVGAAVSSPWWYGLGTGIVCWTALEAAGELYTRAELARQQGNV